MEKTAKKFDLWEAVREKCYNKRWYILAFFLPVAILLTAYAFFKVHPFGDGSVLVLDLNGQYVYYYEEFRDAFWGKGSFIYSWSRNLSGEMFGIYAYYLASPFMLIIAFLPRSMMATSILIMQLAKVGTAAVAFQFYLRKISGEKKPKTVSLIMFPLMYALMAYVVVELMNPMWLDALIYMPLIFWGVHRLINEGKLLPYIVPLALMFIAHFYIGYMVGIITFLYFCYVSLSGKDRILPKHFFSRCVAFGVGTLVSLMCAAYVLIPVYNSLKLGKFEFTDPDFSLATQFDFLTFITKLFPMSYDTVYPEGLPMIYCGTAALILVPLFFLNKNIGIKEKVGSGALAFLLSLFMYIKPVDMAMHGFQVPNWLPYRYSFAFSFFLLVMAFRAFENLDGITFKNIGGIVFGIAVFLFWCEREDYKHFELFATKSFNGTQKVVVQGIWAGLIGIVVYFVLLYIAKKYPKSKVAAVVLVGAVTVELFANTCDTINKIDTDVAYSKYTSYEPYMTNLRNAVQSMKEKDTSQFYRMEATFHRTVNDAMGTGYYSVSHSSSTMNSPALTMLHQLGYAYGGHYTKYDGATLMTDALFDIKYLMNKTNDTSYNSSRVKVPSQYTLANTSTQGNSTYSFYKNPNALGLGVACNSSITGVKLSDRNPFENQNQIFNAMSAQNNSYFTKLDVLKSETSNVTKSALADGHQKFTPTDTNNAEAHVDYVVKVDKTSDLYMYLPTSYERECNIWVQDEKAYQKAVKNNQSTMTYAGQFFVGDNYSILDLGRFTKGQNVRIRITLANDEKEAFWKDQLFYTFDYDTFAATCTQLQKNSMKITSFSDTSLEGKVTANSDEDVLFTTIPYEEGWIIKVNGKTVTPSKSLDSLITIPVSQGENVITMKFSPNYWKMSLVVTGVGVLILLIIFLFEYKKGKYMRVIMAKFGSQSGKAAVNAERNEKAAIEAKKTEIAKQAKKATPKRENVSVHKVKKSNIEDEFDEEQDFSQEGLDAMVDDIIRNYNKTPKNKK